MHQKGPECTRMLCVPLTFDHYAMLPWHHNPNVAVDRTAGQISNTGNTIRQFVAASDAVGFDEAVAAQKSTFVPHQLHCLTTRCPRKPTTTAMVSLTLHTIIGLLFTLCMIRACLNQPLGSIMHTHVNSQKQPRDREALALHEELQYEYVQLKEYAFDGCRCIGCLDTCSGGGSPPTPNCTTASQCCQQYHFR